MYKTTQSHFLYITFKYKYALQLSFLVIGITISSGYIDYEIDQYRIYLQRRSIYESKQT